MPQPQIDAAGRIRDLSSISSSVPDLLSSAGNALQALTGAAPKVHSEEKSQDVNVDSDRAVSLGSGGTDPSLTASKASFTANATAYFTTLQAIMARLRRQVYALEEAGVITAEAIGAAVASAESPQQQAYQAKGAAAPKTLAQVQAEEEARLINGGLGSLDVAYLNSRVGTGSVEKEGELLQEARDLLTEFVEKRLKSRDTNEGTVEEEEEQMDEQS